MTTGHPDELGLDIEDIEEYLEVGRAVHSGKAVDVETARSKRKAIKRTESHLTAAVQEPRWSWPDSAWASQNWRRSVRTIGPIFLADFFAITTAGAIAFVLTTLIAPHRLAVLEWTAPAALALLIASYWMSDLYCEIWIHPIVELRHVTALNCVVFLSAAVGGLTSFPFPIWCAFSCIMVSVLVPLLRVLLRHFMCRFPWWGYPTLIIGTGSDTQSMVNALVKTAHCSLRPALLTDPSGICRSGSLPVVNDPETLESLLRSTGIRHAIFSLPQYSSMRQQRMLDHYGRWIPHLLVLSDRSTLPALWGASRNSGRLSGLEMRNGLLVATMQFAKRVFDISVALIVLPAMMVLTAVLAIVSKITSPGPLFYGHTRIGQHGRRFKVWKYRTMHVDSDRMLREHLAANPTARIEWEEQHKLRDDPRVTVLGKWLRKTSLDELPQIWNVLRGDMSLVGPRPIVQAEVPRYKNSIDLYASVKPGITGLWQVSGRTDISYDERVELDIFYIRHWSQWLDIYILAKTVLALLKRRGAY